MTHLAMAYLTAGHREKSKALLRDALQVASKACGPECDALVAAYAGMEAFYDAQDDSAEARRYAALGVEAAPSSRRPSSDKQ